MSEKPLAGRRVLVTRPLDQTAILADRIRAAGGEPIFFPAIDIGPPRDRRALDAVLDRLGDYRLAIFISPTAVDYAFRAIAARDLAWPAGLRAAAVGPASARALERHGCVEVVVPTERFDSEGLLAHPALADVAGRRVVIFRGGSGRELLGDTLVARGASVDYAACYERLPPASDPAALLARWEREGIDAASFTSSEGFANFAQAIGERGRRLLAATPAFVPHPRIAEAVGAAGVEAVVLTGAGDAALVAALEAYLR